MPQLDASSLRTSARGLSRSLSCLMFTSVSVMCMSLLVFSFVAGCLIIRAYIWLTSIVEREEPRVEFVADPYGSSTWHFESRTAHFERTARACILLST